MLPQACRLRPGRQPGDQSFWCAACIREPILRLAKWPELRAFRTPGFCGCFLCKSRQFFGLPGRVAEAVRLLKIGLSPVARNRKIAGSSAICFKKRYSQLALGEAETWCIFSSLLRRFAGCPQGERKMRDYCPISFDSGRRGMLRGGTAVFQPSASIRRKSERMAEQTRYYA